MIDSLPLIKYLFFRILIFSPDLIRKVNVTIDNKPVGLAKHVEGPLFVLPWQPELYASGTHQIDVRVKVSIPIFIIILSIKIEI